MSRGCDKETLKKCKTDLKTISKFLLHHTNEEDLWEKLKDMNFDEFLYAAGMFDINVK